MKTKDPHCKHTVFPTLEKAIEYALKKRKKIKLWAYQCPTCSLYHVGKHKREMVPLGETL